MDALAFDQQLQRDKLQRLVEVAAEAQNLLNEAGREVATLHKTAPDSSASKVSLVVGWMRVGGSELRMPECLSEYLTARATE